MSSVTTITDALALSMDDAPFNPLTASLAGTVTNSCSGMSWVPSHVRAAEITIEASRSRRSRIRLPVGASRAR